MTTKPLLDLYDLDCRLIGIKELALILHRSEATIRNQASKSPEMLPPRTFLPGSSGVRWTIRDVLEWIEQQREASAKVIEAAQADAEIAAKKAAEAAAAAKPEKVKKDNRGRPTNAEIAAAKAAGYANVVQYRYALSKA